MHNRMHDFAYYLGFDEPHWNAQQYNHGLGGVGNDGVYGNAQAAAISGGAPDYNGRDNANMNTGADGTRPQTNMFLWQPLPGAFYAPCVDGDYDMTVIGHEYGHTIENRMIGKGVGARQGTHAGAMGEAFGDFDAIEYLNAFHYAPVPGSDPLTEGAYVTGNPTTGSATTWRASRWAASSRRRARTRRSTRSTSATTASTTSGRRCTPTARSGSRSQYDIRDLMLDRYPAQGAGSTSPARAGGVAGRRSARGTGAGSSSTTTRCC